MCSPRRRSQTEGTEGGPTCRRSPTRRTAICGKRRAKVGVPKSKCVVPPTQERSGRGSPVRLRSRRPHWDDRTSAGTRRGGQTGARLLPGHIPGCPNRRRHPRPERDHVARQPRCLLTEQTMEVTPCCVGSGAGDQRATTRVPFGAPRRSTSAQELARGAPVRRRSATTYAMMSASGKNTRLRTK